jgi:hypothetical protein
MTDRYILAEKLQKEINLTKNKLIKKGYHERFGQKEFRSLSDKYAKEIREFGDLYNLLIEFNQWCEDF